MSLPDFDSFVTETDESLVRSVQMGDERALSVLLTRYKAMVFSIASDSFGTSLETDDLAQEGFMGLIAAVSAFRFDKQTSFHTYASVCVSNRVRSAVRASMRLKNAPLSSYTEIPETVICDGADPEEILLAKDAAERLTAFLSTGLTDLERNVLRLYLTDLEYKSIAQQLSVSVKSVDNAMQRIRGKIKACLQAGS